MKTIVYTIVFLFTFVSLTYALPHAHSAYLLKNIKHEGSGFLSGLINVILSADARALTIVFDDYKIEISSETRPVISKFCHLTIPIHIPFGWQFSVIDVIHIGGATLDQGVKAKFTEHYNFIGQKPLKVTRMIHGPEDIEYTFVDKFNIKSFSWSPCGRGKEVKLHLRSRIQLNNIRNRKGYGLVDRESTDLDINQTYRFSWRKCNVSENGPIFKRKKRKTDQ